MKRHLLIGLCLLQWTACSDDIIEEGLLIGPVGEPDRAALGLRLVPDDVDLDLTDLSQEEVEVVAKGSYLVNGAAGCFGCHSSEAGYLAGGNEFQLPFLPADIEGRTSVIARNLTPDPDTGMELTEEEFIEAMRTAKDFHDSDDENPQRMIIMPAQVFRFMLEDDLRAIYAYLQRIPPIHNEVREEYVPPFPFPPIPLQGLDASDADGVQRGLQIPRLFSSGEQADAFVDQFEANVAALSAAEQARVGRGSYLVNAVADCSNCHTDGIPDGAFDSGLLPETFDVNTTTYLGGGVDLGVFFLLPFQVLSRNLTPHSDTGLELSEDEFIQTLRFGADFRRPGASLRTVPHFPAEFRMTRDDLAAIYTYLRHIPAVDNDVAITE